ncbi:MAG: hypothetical protein IBX57_02950 [Gammaproteobacteria bacterium]|nr:hypothetical protein [Gammaproteobacteria bacterium]
MVLAENRHPVLLVIHLEQAGFISRALVDGFSTHNRGGYERSTDPKDRKRLDLLKLIFETEDLRIQS